MDKQTLCAENYEVGYIGKLAVGGKVRNNAVVVACEICGKKVASRQDQLRRYCSRECAVASTITKVKLLCDFCGTEYTEKQCRVDVSKSGMHFCSRECKDRAQRLDSGEKFDALRPPHYGSSLGHRAYRRVAFTAHGEACQSCGYDEHKEILQVHHIDGDRLHGDEDNLCVLCPNCHAAITYGYATLGSDRKIVWN